MPIANITGVSGGRVIDKYPIILIHLFGHNILGGRVAIDGDKNPAAIQLHMPFRIELEIHNQGQQTDGRGQQFTIRFYPFIPFGVEGDIYTLVNYVAFAEPNEDLKKQYREVTKQLIQERSGLALPNRPVN